MDKKRIFKQLGIGLLKLFSPEVKEICNRKKKSVERTKMNDG